MTFDSNMQATEQDAIPELYRIVGGGYEWRYTSNRTDITFLGEVYKAATIKRSAFSSTKQIGDSKLTITFPLSEPLLKYISAYPLPSTTVDIYRAVYSSLSQYAFLFSGKVKRASFSNKVISAECSVDDEMSAMLPHIVYQSYCNWQVFDCNCGLNSANYMVSAAVTINDTALVSSVFATYPLEYFTQGWVLFDGDMRFIVGHAGAYIYLQLPFSSALATGNTVSVFPGCDGAPATCIAKYNNWNHWLGMAYIPSRNPVVWGFK